MGAIGGQGRGGPGRRRLCHKQHQPHLEERAGGRAGASIPQVETGQSAGRRPPPPGPPAFGRTHSLRGAGKSRFPCTSSKYLYRNFRKWYSVIVPSGAFFPDVSAETSAPGALWRLADARGGRLFCREPSRGWACSRSRSPATTLGAGAPEAGSRCEPEGGREFGDILRFLSVTLEIMCTAMRMWLCAGVECGGAGPGMKSSALSTQPAADHGTTDFREIEWIVKFPSMDRQFFFHSSRARGPASCCFCRLHG